MSPPAPQPYTGTCTCFRLRKLARLMSQRYDRELAPAGININQYSILRRASSRPRAIGELSRELGMDRTTLSRDLKPLISAGWIEMISGEDARQRLAQVTASGHRVIAKAMPLWRKAQDAIDTGLGKTHVESLHTHLDRAMRQLDDGDRE